MTASKRKAPSHAKAPSTVEFTRLKARNAELERLLDESLTTRRALLKRAEQAEMDVVRLELTRDAMADALVKAKYRGFGGDLDNDIPF